MSPLAVILAGGLGTRLREAVPQVPKAMAPVAGRPFLEYQLDYWIGQGIPEFVLSVGYRYERIVEHFGGSYKNATLRYAIERSPLGTGGGLLHSIREYDITAPFLLLNGDTYFEADWEVLKDCAETHNADWCLSLFRSREENRYMGLGISLDGKIESLASKKAAVGDLANGGVYWVRPDSLRDIAFTGTEKLSLEDDIFPIALASGGRFFGVEFAGTFIDIGIPADYHRAASLLAV